MPVNWPRGPFDRPALDLTLLVWAHQVNEGVWIAEHELDHVSFDFDLLVVM